MSAGLGSPILNRLISCIETLGPINCQENWLGKRQYVRIEMALPVRLRRLDEHGVTHGPALTARSRDVSEQGLGLTLPCILDVHQHFHVEMFTIIGTLTGHMRALHCTQTLDEYKLGMQWIGTPHGSDALSPASAPPNLSLSMTPGKPQSEILTFNQALEEIRQAMRKYYVASISRGLLGLSMEREIQRIIEAMPTPPEQTQPESRRRAFRHEVEGQVHLMVSTPQGYELSNNDIADFSAGGARVVVVPPRALETCGKPPETSHWQQGTCVTMGMWTPAGTLWLPARVTHCDHHSPELISAGLQFTLDKVVKDFS